MALYRRFTAPRAACRKAGTRSGAEPRRRRAGPRFDGRTPATTPRTSGETLKNKTESDAFVFFGATGDLANKKIFPALHAMVRRDNFDIPIIGMARAGW